MDNKKIYLILKVVKQNKNLNLLLREGMTFKSIGELTEIAASENLIQIINDRIILTELGENNYVKFEKLYKKTNKKEWIEKDTKSQIQKIEVNDIFLPNKKNLSF